MYGWCKSGTEINSQMCECATLPNVRNKPLLFYNVLCPCITINMSEKALSYENITNPKK